MSSPLHPDLAHEITRAHAVDLAEQADRYRRALAATSGQPTMASRLRLALRRCLRPDRPLAPADPAAIELRIRYALAEDTPALRRLASLDGSTVPDAPLLVAEVRGEVHAALSLWDGRAIADPFERTEALVELLTVRAAQLNSASTGLVRGTRGRAPWTAAHSSTLRGR